MAAGEQRHRGETALRVLHSLPPRHEQFFFEEIRKLCTDFVNSRGLPQTDRSSAAGELLSEVMTKLLSAGSSNPSHDDPAEAGSTNQGSSPDDPSPCDVPFHINLDAPEQDERIRWLIKEVGGRRALEHRFEDMRRQRWGRWPGSGYRTAQISALAIAEPGSEREEDILARHEESSPHIVADQEDPHHARDVTRAWAGMLAVASRRFKPHEDVQKLLHVLAHDPDVQEGFGIEWPVRKIVEALNRRDPNPPWNDDRVENAKKRLRTWISGLKRDYGLDQTDLMALFARQGRMTEVGADSTAFAPREAETVSSSGKQRVR